MLVKNEFNERFQPVKRIFQYLWGLLGGGKKIKEFFYIVSSRDCYREGAKIAVKNWEKRESY